MAADMRYQGEPLEQAREKLMSAGAPSCHKRCPCKACTDLFNSRPKDELPRMLEELKEILPYSVELHGKFHYLGEDLVEPSIPYKEILAVVKDSDFDGYLICEYEDELYCGGAEFTKRQIMMEKAITGNAVDEVTNMEITKQKVLDFYEAFFNQQQVMKADPLIAEDYIQHNPGVEQGTCRIGSGPFNRSLLRLNIFRLEVDRVVLEAEYAAVFFTECLMSSSKPKRMLLICIGLRTGNSSNIGIILTGGNRR